MPDANKSALPAPLCDPASSSVSAPMNWNRAFAVLMPLKRRDCLWE